MFSGELITQKVRGKLRRLRLAIRAHLVGEAIAWIVIALVGLVLVTLLGDWGLHRLTHQPVGRGQRALILLVCLAGVGYVLWRFLIRRAMVPLRDADLALVVEKRYPQLNDRLISALQFQEERGTRNQEHGTRTKEQGAGTAEIADSTGRTRLLSPGPGSLVLGPSSALIHRMAEQANRAAEGLDFLASVDRRRLLARLAGALGAVAIVVVLALSAGQTMSLWFQRNILLAEVPWPQDTYLLVPGGPEFVVARGADLNVTVLVEQRSRVRPGEVVFHMDFDSVGRVEEVVQPRPGIEGFAKSFANVSEPFRFWVSTGGDGSQSQPCRVRVIEPPELRSVEFTVEYPGYTQLPPRTFDGMQGALSVPPGSRITVQALCTKELSDARFLLDGEPVGQAKIQPGRPGSQETSAPGLVGALELSPRTRGQTSATLRFELTDSAGIVNRGAGSYPIHLVYDRPAGLKVTWLGQGKSVTPRAMFPLEIDASDDYGVVGLTALLTVKDDSLPARKFEIPSSALPGRRVAMPYTLDVLESLNLKPGTVIQLAIQAADSMTPEALQWMPADAQAPNLSRGDAREFQIVSEQDLLAELLRQQKEMRLRMQQVLQAQASARDQMRAASDQVSQEDSSLAEARRLAVESARSQQTSAALASSVVQTYRGILETMDNNRAGRAADRQQISEKIVKPLSELVGKPMSEVVAEIDALAKAGDASTLAGDLGHLAERQQALYARLEAIMQDMVKLESIPELIRLWTDVIHSSEKLKTDMEGRLKDRTKGMFDEPSSPASQPTTSQP